MGLDPIQHHLTLSIVCAVQASGCFLISRAVAKLRSDWQRLPMGTSPLVQARLGEDLASIAPRSSHPFDLQAWDQQFAQVRHLTSQPLAEATLATDVIQSVHDSLHLPPSPQFGGDMTTQSPPELEDLGEQTMSNDVKIGLSVRDSLSGEIDGERLDPWNETIGNECPIEDLPVEDLPVPELPREQPIELNTLFALTVPQLRGHAKQLGLKNYSRQTKAQLLVAIRRHLEGVT
jgi:Rho termination factor, N-terminal domain